MNNTPLAKLTALAAEQEDAYRLRVRLEAAEGERQLQIRQAIQRADVEKHAHRVICQRFPKTLGCVVAAEMWRGYPSHPHGQPSAVAYLGANIYLRYCSDDDFGGASLLLPCAACGIRLTAALRDDHDLTVVLYAPDARTTCARCRSAHA